MRPAVPHKQALALMCESHAQLTTLIIKAAPAPATYNPHVKCACGHAAAPVTITAPSSQVVLQNIGGAAWKANAVLMDRPDGGLVGHRDAPGSTRHGNK